MSRAVFCAAALLCSSAWATSARAKESCVIPEALKSLWPDPKEVVFQATTLHERQVFEELIPALLQAAKHGGKLPETAQKLAATVGFEIDDWSWYGQTFWTLRERKNARHGAGAYVIRTGEAAEVVLQAPHAYHDLGTGQLGAELFVCAPDDYRPRAFLTNTAHRYHGRLHERRSDPDHPADVAHNPDHLFQVATDALVRKLAHARVIQLHGFGPKESRDEDVSAVVSAGTQNPGEFQRRVAARLSSVIGDGVRLFPEQTKVLGATQNAQGRLVQAYPQARFVHIELSAPVRHALTKSAELDRLAKALFAPEGE